MVDDFVAVAGAIHGTAFFMRSTMTVQQTQQRLENLATPRSHYFLPMRRTMLRILLIRTRLLPDHRNESAIIWKPLETQCWVAPAAPTNPS